MNNDIEKYEEVKNKNKKPPDTMSIRDDEPCIRPHISFSITKRKHRNQMFLKGKLSKAHNYKESIKISCGKHTS